MFSHNAYFIETLTNTHVGSGDVTLGVVDKEIQKDPVTFLPVFHPSSVKGAIRDHFEPQVAGDNFQPAGSARMKPFTFKAVFGDLEMETIQDLEDELAGKKKHEEGKSSPAAGMEPAEKDQMSNELKLLRKAPGHGLIKFYEARLLTLPLRSDRRVFHNATSPEVMMDFLRAMEDFNIEGIESGDIESMIGFLTEIQQHMDSMETSEFVVFGGPNDPKPIVEEYENGVVVPEAQFKEKAALISRYMSPRPGADFLRSLAIFKDSTFRDICESGLPVIARNSLDDKGISKNLFYEEILPRRAILWFMTGTYRFFDERDENAYLDGFKFFEKSLTSQNIQMGANASVGYGVTQIHQVGPAGNGKGGETNE